MPSRTTQQQIYLANVRQQVESQQEQVAQAEQQTQQQQAQLRRAQEQLFSQQSLRATTLQSKPQRDIQAEQINVTGQDIQRYQKELGTAKEQLKQFETNVLAPAENLTQQQAQYEYDYSVANNLAVQSLNNPNFPVGQKFENAQQRQIYNDLTSAYKNIEQYNIQAKDYNKAIDEFQKSNPTERLIKDPSGKVIGVESSIFGMTLGIEQYNKRLQQEYSKMQTPSNRYGTGGMTSISSTGEVTFIPFATGTQEGKPVELPFISYRRPIYNQSQLQTPKDTILTRAQEVFSGRNVFFYPVAATEFIAKEIGKGFRNVPIETFLSPFSLFTKVPETIAKTSLGIYRPPLFSLEKTLPKGAQEGIKTGKEVAGTTLGGLGIYSGLGAVAGGTLFTLGGIEQYGTETGREKLKQITESLVSKYGKTGFLYYGVPAVEIGLGLLSIRQGFKTGQLERLEQTKPELTISRTVTTPEGTQYVYQTSRKVGTQMTLTGARTIGQRTETIARVVPVQDTIQLVKGGGMSTFRTASVFGIPQTTKVPFSFFGNIEPAIATYTRNIQGVKASTEIEPAFKGTIQASTFEKPIKTVKESFGIVQVGTVEGGRPITILGKLSDTGRIEVSSIGMQTTEPVTRTFKILPSGKKAQVMLTPFKQEIPQTFFRFKTPQISATTVGSLEVARVSTGLVSTTQIPLIKVFVDTPKTELKTPQQIKVPEVIRQTDITTTTPKTDEIIKTITPPKDIFKSSSIETPSIIEVPKSIEIQKPVQIELLKQAQTPRLVSQFETPSTTIKPFLLIPSEEKTKKVKSILSTKGKGYKVFVKRKGREIEVGRGLPFGKALKRGEQITKTTLARTFRLQEVGQTNIEDISYSISPRQYRQKDSLTFVQRQALTRGTGETQEIISFKRKKQRSIF